MGMGFLRLMFVFDGLMKMNRDGCTAPVPSRLLFYVRASCFPEPAHPTASLPPANPSHPLTIGRGAGSRERSSLHDALSLRETGPRQGNDGWQGSNVLISRPLPVKNLHQNGSGFRLLYLESYERMVEG